MYTITRVRFQKCKIFTFSLQKKTQKNKTKTNPFAKWDHKLWTDCCSINPYNGLKWSMCLWKLISRLLFLLLRLHIIYNQYNHIVRKITFKYVYDSIVQWGDQSVREIGMSRLFSYLLFFYGTYPHWGLYIIMDS